MEECNVVIKLALINALPWGLFVMPQQYVRLTVGAVKTESKIIKSELNPEWNQIFAVGKDKIQGGTLELSVWNAVLFYNLQYTTLNSWCCSMTSS